MDEPSQTTAAFVGPNPSPSQPTRKQRKRYPDPSDSGDGHRTFDRFLLSFMGPAPRGENKAPDGYVPDEVAELCRKCGHTWEAHARVHTDNMTYRPCPTSPG